VWLRYSFYRDLLSPHWVIGALRFNIAEWSHLRRQSVRGPWRWEHHTVTEYRTRLSQWRDAWNKCIALQPYFFESICFSPYTFFPSWSLFLYPPGCIYLDACLYGNSVSPFASRRYPWLDLDGRSLAGYVNSEIFFCLRALWFLLLLLGLGGSSHQTYTTDFKGLLY
jgi:hypothetical protein